MKIRVKVNILMLLMIYYCVFVDFPTFQFYNLIKYACLLVVGLYLISNIRILKRKEFSGINIAIFAFVLVVLYSSWINRSVVRDRDPFLAAIVFTGALAELFLLMEVTAVKGNGEYMIDAYYTATMIITAITDTLILLGVTDQTSGGPQFLVGTKFDISYLHLMLIALYMEKHNGADFLKDKHKMALFTLLTATLGITLMVDCMTGLLGVLSLALMSIVYNQHDKFLYRPLVFLGVLGLSFLMSFIFKVIATWKPLEYFLVHILERDATLTSRTTIFMAVPLLLRGHYLFGFGYGTTYELGMKFGGFPNTQNALWEWIWQCGVLGVTMLILLMGLNMLYIYNSKQLIRNNQSKYILFLLYVYTILASVEITVDLSYLGCLAMLIPLTYTSKQKHGGNQYALQNR